MPCVLIVAGTHSGVGKTTVTCGLLAACVARGLVVQSYKCGPDFLDGLQHQVITGRPCINLDGWMMQQPQQQQQPTAHDNTIIRNVFWRHAQGVDVCIIEGVMGLFDARDGLSDDGSTAEIAKLLRAPVVLVVDAGAMARSVAPMVMGYATYDAQISVKAVIANQVSGSPNHVFWIRQAVEQLKDRHGVSVFLAGGLPKDKTIAIPERHLGLHTPATDQNVKFRHLGRHVETYLDVDGLLELGKMQLPTSMVDMSALKGATDETHTCRIGVAQDEAFCFYYHDNFALLQQQGAELVRFSPVHDDRLPRDLDGLYLGGGYPELYAKELAGNTTMRQDIYSLCESGATVFAECGGFMYLASSLYTEKGVPPFEMCGVLKDIDIRMTPHAKLNYVDIKVDAWDGMQCRGHEFHFSEQIQDPNESSQRNIHDIPLIVTPQLPGASPEPQGYMTKNILASYYHIHMGSNPDFATEFVRRAVQNSPRQQQTAVSFVASATEIIFALDAQKYLAGVTSLCDYPPEARTYPREVLCTSAIDASSMSSEEVAKEMEKVKTNRTNHKLPGLWGINVHRLREMCPRTIFVQNTCEICDPSQDDVLAAIDQANLSNAEIVQVSPTTINGMFDSIRDVAKHIHAEFQADALIGSLKARLDRVQKQLHKLEIADRPRRLVSLEGLAPPCVGGSWLPDIKLAAGCVDAFGDEPGCRARIISWEEILAVDPDVLILSPCSASLERTLHDLEQLVSPENAFWQLKCVKQGEVYIMDHGFFSRPTPRLIDGVELLASVIYGIPSPNDQRVWKDQAMKLQASKGIGNAWDLHGRQLSRMFEPLFDNWRKLEISAPEAGSRPNLRCAHCTVSYDNSLLIFGGDGTSGSQFNDLWRLRCDELRPSWEPVSCGHVADESVPTCRSNSASVVCGNILLIFGGWNRNTPLAACELLHLETMCWTRCSTRGSVAPPPRGNPTLVHFPLRNCVILFGGWNRKERLKDLFCLDLEQWEWKQVPTAPSWPQPRTDHTAVSWRKDRDEDCMIIYGGSTPDGPCSEVWLLRGDFSWSRVEVDGPCPPKRTSHAAVLIGDGPKASMLILGGTNSQRGCSKSGIIGDAWLLKDVGIAETRRWIKLPLPDAVTQRCRHTISFCSSRLWVWGGFDGSRWIGEDVISVWSGTISDACTVLREGEMTRQHRLQDRWEAEVPLRESDLPSDVREKARASTLPNALAKALHRHAVARNKDTYIDPASGYSVFTQVYLKRKPCCGNGCRHCPYGHINVPKCGEKEANLEW